MLQGTTLQLFPSEYPQLYPLPQLQLSPLCSYPQIPLPGPVFPQSFHNSWLSVKHLYPHILLAVHIQYVLEFIKCFSSVLFSVFPSHPKIFSSSLISLHIFLHTGCQVVGIPLNNVMQSFPFHYVHKYFSSS